MESAVETSGLKLSGIWYKCARNCGAKHGANVQLCCNRSRHVLEQVWKVIWYVFWWKPGYRDLLSYVTFSSGRVIGKRVTDIQSLLVHDDAMSNFFVVFSAARLYWCSCASVVIFSSSVVVNSLSGFSVPFSVICMLHSARCMSLLSVGVVE